MNQQPVREYNNPIDRELKRYRKNLHYAARRLVNSFGWIATDKVVQEIKSIFLWHTYKVETSRALDLLTLKAAVKQVEKFEKHLVVAYLEKRDKTFQEKNYKRLTRLQKNKLVRIMVYVIKLNPTAIVTYIDETIGRKSDINNLTISEANSVIRRVEQWEAKIILKK